MSLYCPECGEEIAEDQTYCEWCGSVLDGCSSPLNEILCPVCQGKGELPVRVKYKGVRPFTRICEECGGAGTILEGSAR